MSEPAFKLQEIAAAGTFGTVCIARDLHTGKLVALKVRLKHPLLLLILMMLLLPLFLILQ